ncbi:MAG: hypothetical protein COU65_00450 [Candidatus Pacebacteria bacterium CG10_big_fil_rev_8_21_14_0_10_42_12]|nr:hypothetical protein [Candidatus Parcubacteria bacterium]PIR63043.1 MAG: hypothetical protein COU65_00450 [Candidatus Pacebacteria bacterium CG10_big_fil_rev_8_21_14_0_10_42_12]
MYEVASSPRTEFKNKLNSTERAIEPWQLIASGPTAIVSLLKFISEYKIITKSLPKRVQDRIGSAAVMVFSLWAYCEISGRSLSQLQDDEVLAPALLLYIVAVTQDDYFDELNFQNPGQVSSECYWEIYKSEEEDEMDFQDEYSWAINQIKKNEKLTPEIRDYLLNLLEKSWTECQKAEDEQVARRNDLVDVYDAHILKKQSYGVLGEALTAVLNGPEAMTQNSHETEDAMIAFCLLGGVIDGLADLEEDRGYTASLALSAEQHDAEQQLPKNTTINNLQHIYLRELKNTKVVVASLLLSKLYPIMNSINMLSKRVFKARFNPVSYFLKV